jgi:hypothetical protein
MGGEARFWRRGRARISQRSLVSGVIDRLIGLWAAELLVVHVAEETEGPNSAGRGGLWLGSHELARVAVSCSLAQRGFKFDIGCGQR